jgi:hypothetical protein
MAEPTVQTTFLQKPLLQRSPERGRLGRRARLLAWGGIAYHFVEFAIALAAGIAASSIALIGFGADSLIEALAGFRRPLAFHWRPDRVRGGRTARPAHRARRECRGRAVVGRPDRRALHRGCGDQGGPRRLARTLLRRLLTASVRCARPSACPSSAASACRPFARSARRAWRPGPER